MNDDPFLIFSMGRSGGSNLEHCIRAGIGPGSTGSEVLKNKSNRIQSNSDLEDFLNEVHKSHVGIKTNLRALHNSGFNTPILNELFDYYDKIILNFRHNILKSEVSAKIGAKTGNWHQTTNENHNWKENVKVVKKGCERMQKSWNKHLRYIKNNNISVYKLDYERLYGIKDVEYRVGEIIKVVNWLGYDFKEASLDHIKDILSPENKVNNSQSYQMIQNIDEINRRLGPKFGYLF